MRSNVKRVKYLYFFQFLQNCRGNLAACSPRELEISWSSTWRVRVGIILLLRIKYSGEINFQKKIYVLCHIPT